MSVGGRLRLLAGVATSVVLVALLLRVIDPGELASAVAALDMRLIPPAVALYFVGVWVRAVRWSLMLPPAAAPIESLFRALVVGFTVNNLLPARLGEFARAYLLARWHGVAYGTTLASLVVERILDGLALAALLLASLAFVPAPTYLLTLGLLVGGAFCGGAGLVMLAAWRPDGVTLIGRLVARLCPARLATIVERLAAGFADGLGLFRGWGLLTRLAVLSLLGWGCELALFYVLMLGFGVPASIPLAILGGAAANFATLVPSSPGYVGTFDAVLVKVLVDVAGVSMEQGMAYALVVHATLFVPVVALGAAIMWRANVSFGQVARAGREARRGTGRVVGSERAMVSNG